MSSINPIQAANVYHANSSKITQQQANTAKPASSLFLKYTNKDDDQVSFSSKKGENASAPQEKEPATIAGTNLNYKAVKSLLYNSINFGDLTHKAKEIEQA